MWLGISKTPKIIIWVQNRTEFCTRNGHDFLRNGRDATQAESHARHASLLVTTATCCTKHLCVFICAFAHGQTKERWPKCTGCANAGKLASQSVHCTAAIRASRAAQLGLPLCETYTTRGCAPRIVHASDRGAAPHGCALLAARLAGSAQLVMPHEPASISIIEQK